MFTPAFGGESTQSEPLASASTIKAAKMRLKHRMLHICFWWLRACARLLTNDSVRSNERERLLNSSFSFFSFTRCFFHSSHECVHAYVTHSLTHSLTHSVSQREKREKAIGDVPPSVAISSSQAIEAPWRFFSRATSAARTKTTSFGCVRAKRCFTNNGRATAVDGRG